MILGLPFIRDREGGVFLYSGRTGDLIFHERGTFEGAELGRDVASVGDFDGDLTPDVAFTTRREGANGGLVFVRSGKDLSELLDADATSDYPIRRITNLGAIDQTDVNHYAFSRWEPGLNDVGLPVIVRSSRDDREIPPPDPAEVFGYQLEGGLDVTGDGVPDFAATSGDGLLQLYVYSGQTLGPIIRLHRADASTVFGMTIDFTNVSGEGSGEVVVGDGLSMDIFSAITGELLHRVPASINNRISVFGDEFAIGDVNGDGFDDYISGTFFNGATGEDEVRIHGGAGLFLHRLNSESEISVEESIRRGSRLRLEVTGALPFQNLHLLASRTGNGCTFIPRLDTCIDLDQPILRGGAAETDENGIAVFEVVIPPRAPLGPVWIQAGDPKHLWRGAVKSNVLRLEIFE